MVALHLRRRNPFRLGTVCSLRLNCPFGEFIDPASAPCNGELELNPKDSAKDATVANRPELAEEETRL